MTLVAYVKNARAGSVLGLLESSKGRKQKSQRYTDR
jgi:hypothetical protein